jgi:hypothetical protein
MIFGRSMRLISSVGFDIKYALVGAMQKMSQNNYMISHVGLSVKLDLIEVVL